MPRRSCLDCGRPATGPRCKECHAAHRSRLYGKDHQAERLTWTPAVNAGTVTCWRCGLPIIPGTPWDLGHRGTRPKAPEHAHCNRSAPNR